MSRTSLSQRFWHVATIAVVTGAAMLALISGDPLLLLGVLCAAAGLILLARPAPARRAAVLALPRKSARRRPLAGVDATAMLRRHEAHAMNRRGYLLPSATSPTRTAARRVSLVAAER
jgi:hypothetical protein